MPDDELLRPACGINLAFRLAVPQERQMARVPLLDENDPAVPGETRTFLNGFKQTYGRVLNVARAMSNSPASAKAFYELVGTAYLGNTNLQPKQAELAYFTATAVNNCFY